MTLYIKTGARWREEFVGDKNKSRRYLFTGANSGQLPTDPTIETFIEHKTGLMIPRWNSNAIARNRLPLDSSLWREDQYFAEMRKYVGTRSATETVSAGYIMAQGKIGATGFLGGVRTEKTEDESWGFVRARAGSTPAQQAADPVGAAARDYATTRREISGRYTKSFPSAHLTHDLTRNLKARLSWSTSFGRPPLNNLYPTETANDTQRTLTVSNPSLRPQTAENWDASLEYYFEPVGTLSAGWFHKTIDDYFVTGVQAGIVGSGADNGYNGEYSGYTLLTRGNLGTAVVQGWEFNYQQQFTFLPGLLKGLGLSVNYTVLDTHGNFGANVTRGTGQVAGFIPRTANVSLSWRYRGFGARIVANKTSDYVRQFSAASLGANLYARARTVVNAGVAYQLRPSLGVSLDVANVFNEPQIWYRGHPDQMANFIVPGPTVTFGVNGRF
ncbi:MAG: TonB-dependent receptor domain-containing protein [Opitutaceae bacterium]